MYAAKDVLRCCLPMLIVVAGWLVLLIPNRDLAEYDSLFACGMATPFVQFFTAMLLSLRAQRFIVMAGDVLIFLFTILLFQNIFEFFDLLGIDYDFHGYLDGLPILRIISAVLGSCILILTFLPELISRRSKKIDNVRS